jgi:hypothetical protein
MTLISQNNVILTATPVLTLASAYATGQQVGGVLQFPGAARAGSQSGVVNSAKLIDGDKQKIEHELWLFNSAPAGNYLDKTTWDPTLADLALLAGLVDFAAGDFANTNTRAVCFEGNLQWCYKTPGDPVLTTPLYGVLVCRGTPTWTSQGNLVVQLGVARD